MLVPLVTFDGDYRGQPAEASVKNGRASCGVPIRLNDFIALQWSENHPFFLPPGAEAFKRGNPNAMARFLDSVAIIPGPVKLDIFRLRCWDFRTEGSSGKS